MNSESSWDGEIGCIRHIPDPDTIQQESELPSKSPDVNTGPDENEDFSDAETDLEEDFEPSVPPKANTLSDIYIRICSKLGVVPCSPFLRKIRDEEIDLSHYNVGPNGAKAIAKVLQINTTTTLLNVHDNGIGAAGATALAEMLQDNCFITILDVSMNFIENDGIKALCRMLKRNRSIVELSLESTRIDDASAKHVADALEENYTLRMLNLSSNEIGEQGGVVLADAIQANQGVAYLDLSCNHIRLKGAIAIANALADNTALKTVDLSRNGFADNGTRAVGNALKINTTLRELNLSGNRIGENGAWGLAIGLEENRGLRVLEVSQNPILSRGAVLLAEALIVNEDSTLEQLVLDDVNVSSDFEKVLDELLKQKQSLYVQFGKVIRGQEHRRRGKKQKDLISRILDSIELRGMRIIDFFRAMDKTGRLALTKQEFITGLRTAGIPMRKTQVDELFELLDVDGNGLAQYAEFVKVIKKRTHDEFAKTRNNFQWNH